MRAIPVAARCELWVKPQRVLVAFRVPFRMKAPAAPRASRYPLGMQPRTTPIADRGCSVPAPVIHVVLIVTRAQVRRIATRAIAIALFAVEYLRLLLGQHPAGEEKGDAVGPLLLASFPANYAVTIMVDAQHPRPASAGPTRTVHVRPEPLG